ncbi:periplasmic heavy metal sensor [Nitratidesulfovibrio liaohensis]|jgi:zinc resistance-associated protein|uniref:Periplasmic heavy metal sensor n=1 Tax=Nitratidesulfovibrio liaohensis TaxID=2604158 RepID=A0ABY9R695_9BACT|nr:periplasmic heavy metal sensor [Nitratidesulfovibrio liaohensis]WMW66328.1 periplasmic heavy metal sensor [Nitratidesulfovibrio liaohensis]
MKIATLAIVLAAFVMAFGLTENSAHAQMGMGQGMGMMGGGGYQLSPEQQAAVQKIYQEQGQTVMNLRQQLAAKQYELNAATMGPNPDEKKALSLVKDISILNEKLITAEFDLRKQLAQQGIPSSGGMGMGMMGGSMGHGMGMGMMGGCGW